MHAITRLPKSTGADFEINRCGPADSLLELGEPIAALLQAAHHKDWSLAKKIPAKRAQEKQGALPSKAEILAFIAREATAAALPPARSASAKSPALSTSGAMTA
jgi:hypothetical protein